MNKNIGDMTRSELIDYVIELQEENSGYERKIDKAIEELDKYINSCEIEAEHTLNNEKCLISVNHSKKVKNILQGNNWNEVEKAYLDDKPIRSDKE